MKKRDGVKDGGPGGNGLSGFSSSAGREFEFFSRLQKRSPYGKNVTVFYWGEESLFVFACQVVSGVK